MRVLLGLLSCAGAPESPSSGAAPPASEGVPGGLDTGFQDESEPEPLPLCINEFMPDNASSWRDDLGAAPDWIELHNPTDTAVDLGGWTVSDDEQEPAKGALSGRVGPGEFLFLRADAQPGVDHLPFRLSADGGQVVLFAPNGAGQVVSYGVVGQDFSVARVTDCCTGDGCLDFSFRGTPGYGNAEPGPPGESVLPEGSFWRVSVWPAVPPVDWPAPGFDDSGWMVARAPLGYGEDDLATVLDAGPPDARVRTVWARSTFLVDELPESAYLRLRVDDGARVLLNGAEVSRINLPEGDIGPDTLATAVVGGEDERRWIHVEVAAEWMVIGENQLAVEVHQATATSEDLVLDLGAYLRR